MLSRRILLALAMAGSFAMSGAALAQDKIKIGAVLAVTGPASFLGDPEAKTLKMLADEINAKGGVLGKQIEIVIYDFGRRRRQGQAVRHPPRRGRQGHRPGGRLDHRRHHGHDPGVRGRQAALHLAGRRGDHHRSGEEVRLQDAAHRQDGVREDLRGHEGAQTDQDRHDLGPGRLRQIDAGGVQEGRRQVRHRNAGGRDLRAARHRHDPAAHQHQSQSRAAGRSQSRLRPGPCDRHAQLQTARLLGAALSEPRRGLEGLHRRGR